MPVVQIRGLVKRYGELTAVDHLDLTIEEGEIFGLLGPNGSGKSTTINCLLQLLTYDRGEIEVFGKPMSPNAYDLKRDIGVVFQDVAVFNDLSVRDNIDYFCGLYVTDRRERRMLVDEAIEAVGLGEFEKFRPKKLSGGLLRRLNIACGIAHKPKLIILDEPTVAVDPQSRNRILDDIAELNRHGATVLYTSHYMEEVEQLCSRMAIMDRGRVIAAGTKEELKAMIETGEKITLEIPGDAEGIAEQLRHMDFVTACTVKDNLLYVKAKKDRHALFSVLEYLKARNVSVGRAYSELPTLNDVFLEITGRELRDNV